MPKRINSLISFVGNNDTVKGKREGAILTVFKKIEFEELHLLYTIEPDKRTSEYFEIAKNLESILNIKIPELAIILHKFELHNPTNHNEIYPKLLKICNNLPKGRNYTAAIASGTPAMQVCWILMAESGDFNLNLIRSNEPKYGKDTVTKVKLETGLPLIKKLKKDNKELTKNLLSILLPVLLDQKKRIIKIGEDQLYLSNIEFCYYKYFLNRAYYHKFPIRVTNNIVPETFKNEIDDIFHHTFPELEKRQNTNFSSNISKINLKISLLIENNSSFYKIISTGTRGNKAYSIELPSAKIKIK